MMDAATKINLGPTANWVIALGTAAAFFVALTLLALQIRDARRRDATRVYASLRRYGDDIVMDVHNGADQPVYACSMTPFLSGQLFSKDRSTVRIVLPGQTETRPTSLDGRTIDLGTAYLGVQLTFTDSAGLKWRRRPDGRLRRRWR